MFLFFSFELPWEVSSLGWVVIIEDATGTDVPGSVETAVTLLVMLFCIFWHSLMMSAQRVADFARVTGQSTRPSQIRSPLQKFGNLLVRPISMINKGVGGFSMSLAKSFNLKAAPKTSAEILAETAEKLGIESPEMMLAKFGVRKKGAGFIEEALKRQGVERTQRKEISELAVMVLSRLDSVCLIHPMGRGSSKTVIW